jgi:Hypervirulence associated proteins TUDOR domain
VTDEFKKGDKVQWKSAQGTVEGTVEKKLTAPTDIKGHHVAASEEIPEYLVKSDKTGKQAAHKPESLEARESE